MSKPPRSPFASRLNLVLLIAAVVLAAGYVIYTYYYTSINGEARRYERASLANAGGDNGASIGGSFALVNQDGQTVTETSFGDKFLLVTFGFTYCPDVCPTKLQDMSLTLDQLGENAKWVQPILISIDPQRDTPKQMKSYVSLYHNNIQGLTGSAAQIAEVAKTFKIYYRRGEDVGDGNYMMDHSTAIYLLDRDGKVLEAFGDEVHAEQMAQAIKKYLPQ